MPDIKGRYSLTEASKEIDVTPSFINRVQRETGIGGRVGIKGQPTSFDREEIEIFKRIKALRVYGFSFKEIRQIWQEETKFQELLGNLEENYKETAGSWEVMPLIIHPTQVRFPRESFIEASEDPRITTACTPLRNNLISIAEEVKRRRDKFMKDVENTDQALKTITGTK
jgi:DNA-binding transcriptional MerR regulator